MGLQKQKKMCRIWGWLRPKAKTEYKTVLEFWDLDAGADATWKDAKQMAVVAKGALLTGLLLRWLEAPQDKNACRKVAQSCLKQARDHGVDLLPQMAERATKAVMMTLSMAA